VTWASVVAGDDLNLLDALEALEPHLDAIVLVGAQAVCLHTSDTDLAVAE